MKARWWAEASVDGRQNTGANRASGSRRCMRTRTTQSTSADVTIDAVTSGRYREPRPDALICRQQPTARARVCKRSHDGSEMGRSALA